MPRYAAGTRVPVDRTIAQIKSLLDRFGCDAFALATTSSSGQIGFRYKQRAVRFDLPLPDRNAKEFLETPTGRLKSDQVARAEWEALCRAKWRSLFLLIKALLVAVEDGLLDFDRAFMHDIVTADGRTVGQHLLPAIQSKCDAGGKKLALLLPG